MTETITYFFLWLFASLLGSALSQLVTARQRARELREIKEATERLLSMRAWFRDELLVTATEIADVADKNGDHDVAQHFRTLVGVVKGGAPN